MPFDTLPSRNLQFPSIQPFTAPGPPVFETGPLMNLLAGNIRENSPEARLARQEAREAHRQALEISKLKTEELRYNQELLRDPKVREQTLKKLELENKVLEEHAGAYSRSGLEKTETDEFDRIMNQSGYPRPDAAPAAPGQPPAQKKAVEPMQGALPAPDLPALDPNAGADVGNAVGGAMVTPMELPKTAAIGAAQGMAAGLAGVPPPAGALAMSSEGVRQAVPAAEGGVDDGKTIVETTPDGWTAYKNDMHVNWPLKLAYKDQKLPDGTILRYNYGTDPKTRRWTLLDTKEIKPEKPAKTPSDEFLTGAARAGVDIDMFKTAAGDYDRPAIAKERERLRAVGGKGKGKTQDPEAKAIKDLMASHQSGGLLSSVQRAKGLTGWTTAGLASWLQHVPATDARKLAAELTTTKALLAGEALQQMKSVSAAGASGLGALSDKERVMLESMQGNLDQGLEPGDLKETLSRIETRVKRWTDMVSILKKEGVEAATKFLETEQAKDGTAALITPEGAGAPARSPTPSPSPAPTPSATPAAGATPAATGEPAPGTVETFNGQQLEVGKTYFDENGKSAVYAGNGKFK